MDQRVDTRRMDKKESKKNKFRAVYSQKHIRMIEARAPQQKDNGGKTKFIEKK